MKILVPFSGGKDSQATLLYVCEKYGSKNVIAVFCDTKWEHDITYNHIKYVVDKIGCQFVNLLSEKYDGFVDLAKKKKRMPSLKARFCTTELKVIPMIDYILSLQDNVLIFQGIRADESESRSQMSEQCTFFKYYFQPYQTNTMIVEKYTSMKKKLSLVQRNKLEKAQARLLLGKEDPKFHTYRKKDVFAFCKLYADDIDRPFFNSTANEVIYFSLNRDYVINPLYFLGFSRVGCFPCILATKNEIWLIICNHPEIIEKIKNAEYYTNATFFKPDYVPLRYRRGFDPKSGKKITSVEDVINYLNDCHATMDAFEFDDEVNGCKSVYAICE